MSEPNEQREAPDARSADYSRRLYDDVLGWYQNADAKAQVALGFDGAFLAFVAVAAFQKPVDLVTVKAAFLTQTWLLLGLMTATLVASMAAAIYCLWSRVYFAPTSVVDSIRSKEGAQTTSTYPPGVMWFFQFIGVLDPVVFLKTLNAIDAAFEVEALASQIVILSNNVRKKHVAANVAFALATVTLLLFAAAAVSYVITVRRA